MRAVLPPSIEKLIDLALDEDLGRSDITTDLSVPKDAQGKGEVVSRGDIVISGVDVFALVMKKVSDEITVNPLIKDGDTAKRDQVVLETSGPIGAMLMAERTALNFLQRLCGTATLTRKFVDSIPKGKKTRIVDTRKTTPGMRYLEKKAVVDGGGFNHRVDLSGGVLIKENHIVAAGGIQNAIERCKKSASHTLKIQVEVKNESELQSALEGVADAVLLDNMTPTEIRRCVEIVGGRAIVEASGNVNLDTVAAIAAAGVDIVSVGALTHSAPAANLSFLLKNL